MNFKSLLTSGSSSYESGLGFVFGFLLILILIYLVIALVSVVAKWQLYKKAGKEGWAAIIPVYSTYVETQIAGLSPYWLIVTVATAFISGVSSGSESDLFSLISLVLSLANIYFYFILNLSFAKSYGKSEGFGVCMALFPIIFLPVLAFSKDTKYVGVAPVGDLIRKYITKDEPTTNNNVNSNVNNSVNQDANANATSVNEQQQNTAGSYCPNCGKPVSQTDVFCQSCGSKLM